METGVQSLNDSCSEMKDRLERVREQSFRLVTDADRLQAETKDKQIRKSIVEEFLQRFSLSEKELQLLLLHKDSNAEDQLTPAFFEAMASLQKTQQDCKSILSKFDRNQAGYSSVIFSIFIR